MRSLPRLGCDCLIRIDGNCTPTILGKPQLRKHGVSCGWEGIRQMASEIDGKHFFGQILITGESIVLELTSLPKVRSRQLFREIVIGPQGIILGQPQPLKSEDEVKK